jgi:isoleucyl-tRNA synthetase
LRRRVRGFWLSVPDAPPTDSLAAQATLHEVLVQVAVLLAPFCPFVADRIWRDLTGAGDDQSVHLADWPAVDGRGVDEGGVLDAALDAQMALARRLASLGRAARSEAGGKVRQPLGRALVVLPAESPSILSEIVADELNVDEVVVTHELGEVLRYELVPNFKVLGPRLGPAVKHLRRALDGLDAAAVAQALDAGETVTVEVADGAVELGPGDLDLRIKGQPGFAVSRDGGEVVALDLTIDDQLRRRGVAREVVRLVQDLRKAMGLDVSDRIHLTLVGLDDLVVMFPFIGREVLATEVVAGAAEGVGTPLELEGYPEARTVISPA